MEWWHWLLIVGAALVGVGVGTAIGYYYRRNIAEAKTAKAEDAVKKMIDDAQKRAETLKKETILEAKEEVYRIKTEQERENKERRNEVQRAERRLQQREESFDKKLEGLEKREEQLMSRTKEVDRLESAAKELFEKQKTELERVAAMTGDEAKAIILNNAEKEARHDATLMIRDIESKAKAEADRRAVNIIASAIQRCAADHVAETTISVVPLRPALTLSSTTRRRPLYSPASIPSAARSQG